MRPVFLWGGLGDVAKGMRWGGGGGMSVTPQNGVVISRRGQGSAISGETGLCPMEQRYGGHGGGGAAGNPQNGATLPEMGMRQVTPCRRDTPRAGKSGKGLLSNTREGKQGVPHLFWGGGYRGFKWLLPPVHALRPREQR